MVKTEEVVDDLDFLRDRARDWESDSLPLVDEIKVKVTEARQAMESDPPDLYGISNALVELSILNIRLIDRIIQARYIYMEAKGLHEARREEWKVKLVKGYTEVISDDGESGESKVHEPVAAGVADSMKVSKVREEYSFMNEMEHNYELVNLTRRAIEKAMDAIRSKLSYEKAHET